MDKLTIFINRLNKLNINIELFGNYPWIYIDTINDKRVTEKFLGNHGFTIMFTPIKLGQQHQFTDIKEIFKLIRKYMNQQEINDKVSKPFIELICTNVKPFPINEIGPRLELNKEYILIDKYICGCKEEHYDVGLPLDENYARFVECYKCRERLPDTTHWCHSSRFKIK